MSRHRITPRLRAAARVLRGPDPCSEPIRIREDDCGEKGVARFTLPASGEYAVTLLMHGMTPEIRAVRLSSGCAGELNVKVNIFVRP